MNNGIFIDFEFDGYIDKVPYKILEYNPNDRFWENVEFDVNIVKSMKGVNAVSKLIWIVINYNSYFSWGDDFPLELFHITPEQLSEMLGENIRKINFSLKQLIRFEKLKEYKIEGKSNLYVAL